MKLPRVLRAAGHPGRVGELVRGTSRLKNWPAVARRYLGLGGGYPLSLTLCNGATLTLETPHDLVTAWILFCREEYRPEPSSEVVVDLGANIGAFTLFAVDRCPRSRLFAFEPFPDTFARLAKTVAQNRPGDRVTCLPMAVSGAGGVRAMPVEGVAQSRGLCAGPDQPGETTVEVESLTLAELVTQVASQTGGKAIDFLKIDIEGSEHEVFADLPDDCLAEVKLIGMEYHPNGDEGKLFAAITRQGLELVHKRPFGPNVGVAHFARRGG